jgi:acetyltransferase-like isoleucine patch superfamily enzyme
VIGRVSDFVRHPMNAITLRARITRPYWSRRLGRLGEGTILHKPTWVYGAHKIGIGANGMILHGAWLSVQPAAWEHPGFALSIGDRVALRPSCVISVSEEVVIEDDVIVAAFSSIIDSDHTFAAGRPNVMHNPEVTAPIRIGRGTWIGERVAVLKGANIGRCCIVGANSVVRGEIPDYSIAVGAPARVVGRVEGVDADAPPVSDRLW